MNKNWYRAYHKALSALVLGHAERLSPAEMVEKAGVIADASEAYLTKRGNEEDAADEAKRQAWEKEATEKVLRIGWYSVGGLGGPGDPRIVLTVREVRGGRVYFHDNLRQIESADLADVDMEDGFMPAPIDEPSGSGSGGGVGVILVHHDGATVQFNAGGSSSAGEGAAVSVARKDPASAQEVSFTEPHIPPFTSPHIPHAFVAGNGGAGGTASPNPMAGGTSNGQGPHGFKREPQR